MDRIFFIRKIKNATMIKNQTRIKNSISLIIEIFLETFSNFRLLNYNCGVKKHRQVLRNPHQNFKLQMWLKMNLT